MVPSEFWVAEDREHLREDPHCRGPGDMAANDLRHPCYVPLEDGWVSESMRTEGVRDGRPRRAIRQRRASVLSDT